MTDPQWLSSSDAAEMLGVKVQTIYAYVSRGLLHSHPVPGRRASRFAADEVRRLAARSGRPQELEVVVDSPLTLLDPSGGLWFRGWEARSACTTAPYEAIAEWLWNSSPAPALPWAAPAEAIAVGSSAQQSLPRWATPVDRMRVAVAATACTDPLRQDRRPASVVATGRSLIATLVDSLPLVGSSAMVELKIGGVAYPSSIASRLWPRVALQVCRPESLTVLNAALGLLADHELAASTLAARVAASAWADPYLVVLTGLGVVGGVLHGASSEQIRTLLRRVEGGEAAAWVVGEELAAGTGLPGFGHRVYEGADPRAAVLLELIGGVWPDSASWRAANEVLAIAADREMPAPNVDFALGVLANCASMIPGGAEAVFATARSAGWIAHAIEEYPYRLRFRPRAVYTGPAPGAVPGP
ncbi:MAG TPA: citrate synthase [Acidimicrobiales bacterium]|nr:citrate synthase [Acidimicrobiales bacterium]